MKVTTDKKRVCADSFVFRAGRVREVTTLTPTMKAAGVRLAEAKQKPQVDTAPSPPAATDDYDEMTVGELRDECEGRGLQKWGLSKAELIDSLRRNDA